MRRFDVRGGIGWCGLGSANGNKLDSFLRQCSAFIEVPLLIFHSILHCSTLIEIYMLHLSV
jgi:hypothetical protein